MIAFRQLLAHAGLLIVLQLPLTASAASVVVLDPAGDTFGTGAVQQDILSITATILPGPPQTLEFTVEMKDPFSLASAFAGNILVGYIVFDADQNPATGVDPAALDPFLVYAGHLGVDFFVDLFSELSGQVELVDAEFNLVRTLTLNVDPAVDPTKFSFTLDLADLGSDRFDFGAVLGTHIEATDTAFGTTGTVVPEPASILLWTAIGGLLLPFSGKVRRRRSCLTA